MRHRRFSSEKLVGDIDIVDEDVFDSENDEVQLELDYKI